MSTITMEEMPSPIKPPPSPLETEADVDDDGPSSVEAQADPSDLSFDLDLDLPTPSYPLSSPQPSTSGAIGDVLTDAANDGSNPFVDLFTPNSSLEPDVKVENGKAGICGFYNFANTCYMNSGLQCLLATPTIVKYFTEDLEHEEASGGQLVANFQPLLRDVWAGDYALLKPVSFKESLSTAHPQFAGAHQHDCQEFLALLLDSMHEELRQIKGFEKTCKIYESDCGTSMELHTAHSTEKEAAMSWLSRNSSLDNEQITGIKRVNNLEHQSNNEMVMDHADHESASPKSYDSRSSSVEDKVVHAIRQLPIPKTLKMKNSGLGKTASSCHSCSDESSMLDADFLEDEEDVRSMDSVASSSQPASNLIALDSLKRPPASAPSASAQMVRFSEDQEDPINNAGDKQSNEDFLQKENKTLNVNVLAEDSLQEMNNEISFDSEKFAKCHEAKLSKPRGTIENNLLTNSSSKRLKNEEKEETSCETHADHQQTSQAMNNEGIKRIRLDSSEKNIQLEMERSSTSGSDAVHHGTLMPTSPTLDPARLKEAIEADRYWEKYLAINDTVLARTFQGQFKSSVVCNTCHYVSVSFEPFMYLPVPLPNANIRQVQVVHVSTCGTVTCTRLDMSQADNVGHLKSKLIEELGLENVDKLQMAEVNDAHIARVVDDWTMLKCLKDDRQIYALSINEFKPMELETKDDPSKNESEKEASEAETDDKMNGAELTVQSCVICMEDLPSNELKQHNACDCIICIQCLERTIEHHAGDTSIPKDHIKCPGCRQEAEPSAEFVNLDQIGKSKPKLRILNLPVLSRKWVNGSYVNIGHPTIVQVPNQMESRQLWQILDHFIMDKSKAKLAFVNAKGKLCSRCIFNSNCFGCIQIENDEEKEVLLQINDSIAITYDDFTEDIIEPKMVMHESMTRPRIKDKLTLNDCLEAFSRTEELDDTNPWYCPMCRKNKCATKTLSVWRFPDYLIIYLKRFIFTNSGALKLEKDVDFEVSGLDLTPYLSGPLQSDSRPVFDMYGCVCHFGCVYGGHYTAFAKHLGTDQWNHFNDNCIQESKIPGESLGDHSSAYILFYQRSGSKHENLMPILSRKCRAFALDNEDLNNKKQANGETEDIIVDNEEDEAGKPDLSQIIRSLDTPPPS